MVSVTKALINNELSLILNKMYLSSFFTTIRVVGQSAALRPFYYPVCFISPSVISSPPMSYKKKRERKRQSYYASTQ